MAAHLHREIATAVRGLDDPRLGLVAITRCEMTADLQTVTAFWTVLGAMRERKLATHALESARAHVRAAFAPALHTRLLPELRFAYDDREERGKAMGDAIARARRTDSDGGSRPEPPIAGTELGPPSVPAIPKAPDLP